MEHRITDKSIADYRQYLAQEERAAATVQKYLHAVEAFAAWLGCQNVTKELVSRYKSQLLEEGRAAVSVNGVLAALHGYFYFRGWQACRVKYLKIQRRAFRDASRDLSKPEYKRLVQAAKDASDCRLALILETICATGVRVSELKYITVAAAAAGRAEISMKGKIRTVLIPGKLCRKLLCYAKQQKIPAGEIFLTNRGRSVSRQEIWRRMKGLCSQAGVEMKKAFPHNLRHLFARCLYQSCRDVVYLADVLGHSSVETTRIYLITTGDAYARQLESLALIT